MLDICRGIKMEKYGYNIDGEVSTRKQWAAGKKRKRRKERVLRKMFILFLLFLILLVATICVILFTVRKNESAGKNLSPSGEVQGMDDNSADELSGSGDNSDDAGNLQNQSPVNGDTDNADNGGEVFSLEKAMLAQGNKVVYLTFDDGPSHNTDRILDILNQYCIKATFFTVGKTNKEYESVYNRILQEGHTLGMHSYSHNYKSIYSSVEAFDEDFKKIREYIKSVTGYEPVFYRFPGGSSNDVSEIPMENFIKYLNENNIKYFDWNASAGDAEGKNLSAEDMIANILKDVKKKDVSVVLMHDSDSLDTTVDMLPKLIDSLLDLGAVFLPITDTSTLIQHVEADSVKP